MANYMKQVAEMLGVELDENFVVIHGEGRSTVKLTENGLVFVFHLGGLKEDAKSICLYNILNGDFEIEHIEKSVSNNCIPEVVFIDSHDEELIINGKSVCKHRCLYPSDVLSVLDEYGVIKFKSIER